MKDLYNKPEIEIILFESVDIITTSGFGDNDAENPWGPDDLG